MRLSVNDIQHRKTHSEKIVVVTAYDYSTAKVCDSSGIEIILVGDSAGMVMLGYPNTIPVTMDDMLVFCKGVVNGSKTSMVIADMPFGSYQSDISLAFLNAAKFIKLGCNGIKIEGGTEMTPVVKKLSENGIPVMAHIGLKPQTSPMWEGYKVQGKTLESAVSLIDAAIELEKAGAFSIVLEMVTAEIAEKITQSLSIPTIGIGSGNKCDGQVLVLHDLIGLYDDIKPKFAKRYMESFSLISDAIKNYVNEVKTGQFPNSQSSFFMPDDQIESLRKYFSSRKSS
jgi:3-methyl-2-oxobutanoate hydroxymethyltransferase